MTREQEIEIEVKSAKAWSAFSAIPDIDIRLAAEQTIDCYVALGMLTLDEPKSEPTPAYRAFEAVFEWVPSLDFADFKKLIDEAGLRIVEK